MQEKRQLTDAEKQEVLERHGRRCFVDGGPIGEAEPVDYHHIKAFSEGGPTTLDNIAPVCRRHHTTLGTMSLQEYRDKLELERFFGDAPKYLGDLIRFKRGRSGERVRWEAKDTVISLYLQNVRHDYPLHSCTTTGWKYFYATLPVAYVENDRDLQPRPLRPASVWSLYRHFQTNTQLAPSICRMDEFGTILLFDGQHKAAAQIWSGRSEIECKVYIAPDARRLKETNLEAHGPLRQMSFYSHELMKKYADIFGEDWNEYMNTEGEKSELGFFNFLVHAKKKTKARARNEIVLAIFNQIVDDPSNKLSNYLAEKHRARKQPLSFARLKKTFFQHMLLSPPVADEFESDTDFRREERRNLVNLMNIVVEEGLDGRWAPERNDAEHRKAERIFSAGAVRAWTILLRDAINAHLRHYSDPDRIRFFYRRTTDEDLEYFRKFVRRILSHKVWDDPDPTGEISARLAKDDARTAKRLFDEVGLTAQWVLGLPSAS